MSSQVALLKRVVGPVRDNEQALVNMVFEWMASRDLLAASGVASVILADFQLEVIEIHCVSNG